MIDFTNCKRIISKAYSGANGKKIAIEYEGARYMLKFPPSGKSRPTELSYTNSCYSEHIGSSIFNMLGVEAQKTLIGEFAVRDKRKIVCACKDFTVNDKHLYDFCAIKNTVIDSEHGGTGTELTDIMDTIQRQNFVNPNELSVYFWNMFIIDAFLGNFDRHNGNWGFLIDEITQQASIAPVFDCGSCLVPQADEKVMKTVINNEDELNARVYQFPTSAIKLNEKKINYYEFITSHSYIECDEALKRIVPRINLEEIEMFIDREEGLSKLQKTFYKKYLASRYEKILKPAFEYIL